MEAYAARENERAQTNYPDRVPVPYNWWSHTQRLVRIIAVKTETSPDALRTLSRGEFRQKVARVLWHREFTQRYAKCQDSVRLRELLGPELDVVRNQADFKRRAKWPGAPYKHSIDDKYHARLLASARLGVLAIEIETGRRARPQPVPRDQRWCPLGCQCVENLSHFLSGCEQLTEDRVGRLTEATRQEDGTVTAKPIPKNQWKGIAHRLARRWRERAQTLAGRKACSEAENDTEALPPPDADPKEWYASSDIRHHCVRIHRASFADVAG
jgi:hypothetical protein